MQEEEAHAIAVGNEILRGAVGSAAHGTALPGISDHDELGVFIEPPAQVLGFDVLDRFARRDRPRGAKAEPGDLELTMLGLRRFCRYAMHALRLGYEGTALMRDGRLPVPVPEVDVLRAVRRGEVGHAEVLRLIGDVEERLRRAVAGCGRVADRPAVEAFMISAYLRHWGEARASG